MGGVGRGSAVKAGEFQDRQTDRRIGLPLSLSWDGSMEILDSPNERFPPIEKDRKAHSFQ